MTDKLLLVKKLLADLVSFPIISGDPNLSIIEYIVDYLAEYGVNSQLIYDDTRDKANLFATIGPSVDGGIILSGHTDVVPVDGQEWTRSPFNLNQRGNRLYGRGSVDMKGFIACCLAQVPDLVKQELQRPVHLAITFDEETGSFGAKILAQYMQSLPFNPGYAIVGEPTEMKVMAGHKGGFEITTTVTGVEGHSSNPDRGVSAIHFAVLFINNLLRVRESLTNNPVIDSAFDPPFSSINIGTITGGVSRNTIAGECRFDWELRLMPEDDGEQIMAQINTCVETELLPQMRNLYPQAGISTVIGAAYPGLANTGNQGVLDLMHRLTGSTHHDVVPFGTDAGYFQQAGIETIVFGPGSIEQAHKPDEYIEISQLKAGIGFLDRLSTWAITGQ